MAPAVVAKAGFLRSETSLIQTIGRAARNVNAKVILYADTITPAMQKAIDETTRRRQLQVEYNRQHGIEPETIKKAIRSTLEAEVKARRTVQDAIHANDSQLDTTEIVKLLEEEMLQAAQNLEFERAAQLRDKINELKGAPVIHSGSTVGPEPEGETRKIWQPRSAAKRAKSRRIAK